MRTRTRRFLLRRSTAEAEGKDAVHEFRDLMAVIRLSKKWILNWIQMY